MVKLGISNSDNKNKNKNIPNEIDDNIDNCNCGRCKELKNKKKSVQRQNFLLSNIVAFGQ